MIGAIICGLQWDDKGDNKMNYLIKFNENGRREKTFLVDGYDEATVTQMINEGFEVVTDADFNLLIGNKDGNQYIKNPQTGEYEPEPKTKPQLTRTPTLQERIAALEEITNMLAEGDE